MAGNYLRIAPILKSVRSLRQRSLQLSQTPPSESHGKELKELADIYRRTQSELPICLAEEKQEWSTWLNKVQEAIPIEISIGEVVGALRAVIEDVVNQGISAGISRSKLEEILTESPPLLLIEV